MKPLFKLREFVWVIVSELEDLLYPYRTDADKPLWEETEQHVDELTYFKTQLQSDSERIDRLQSEMLYVTSQIHEINTMLQNRNNEGQEGSKIIVEEGKETS
tara:strand:- start:221 stop:526 length:306 start_codon:yes stop_codon:yes gene_type:complete